MPSLPTSEPHAPAMDDKGELKVGQATETGSEDDPVSSGRLALRTVLGLLALFVFMAIGALYLKAPLEEAGRWFFEAFGLPGMFVGTALSDFLGVPIPVDVYLAAAVTAKTPTIPALLVASVASVVGGNMAYALGAWFERVPLLKSLVARFKAKGEAAFERWGVAAVAIAAWTPVPFSIICWAAGAFKMPWKRFFLTSLHRVPRVVLYYYVITLGWSAGNLW